MRAYIQLIAMVFIPNDRNGGVRKARIDLFQKNGGIWVREWDPIVKYVMVEDRMDYLTALKYLRVDKVPVSENKSVD
jgi:hypothetical protein